MEETAKRFPYRAVKNFPLCSNVLWGTFKEPSTPYNIIPAAGAPAFNLSPLLHIPGSATTSCSLNAIKCALSSPGAEFSLKLPFKSGLLGKLCGNIPNKKFENRIMTNDSRREQIPGEM